MLNLTSTNSFTCEFLSITITSHYIHQTLLLTFLNKWTFSAVSKENIFYHSIITAHLSFLPSIGCQFLWKYRHIFLLNIFKVLFQLPVFFNLFFLFFLIFCVYQSFLGCICQNPCLSFLSCSIGKFSRVSFWIRSDQFISYSFGDLYHLVSSDRRVIWI